MTELNKNIKITDRERKKHTKASEQYIQVIFTYSDSSWEGWVPVEYRRTRVSITTEDELYEYLNQVYMQMNPINLPAWKEEQEVFWNTKRAKITRSFFDSLKEGGWQCANCTLPKNPNFARRIQDLKEYGYTIATDSKRYCPKCGGNKTHHILLPITRVGIGRTGYETWSIKLRKRIVSVLKTIDIYENVTSQHCLPDHKFPEIRWDDKTKESNPDNMTDNEIQLKFQLLTNQRNQQKREVCRNCYQTGKRGVIFGIPYFYAGRENWDEQVPIKGKAAEKGCFGCPWYDIQTWRESLLKKIREAVVK